MRNSSGAALGGSRAQAAAGIRAQSLTGQQEESQLREATGSPLAVRRREPRTQMEAPQPERARNRSLWTPRPVPLHTQTISSPLHQIQENVNILREDSISALEKKKKILPYV